MARYTKTTVSSVSGVNSELDKISTALDNMLDREGATPNQMEVDLDMNSNDILNASTVYTQNLAIDGALVSTSEPVATVQTVTTETATATAGQTLFNLSNEYVAGANTLTVFVNGVKMRLNTDYTETSSSSVTFTSGLSLNDIVEFYIGRYVTDATLYDSDAVTYDPPFTGSTATTVETKLSETVSVKDFGAVGDGVTDDASAVQDFLDYISSNSVKGYVPSGTYRNSTSSWLLDSNTDVVIDRNATFERNFVGTNTGSVSLFRNRDFTGGATNISFKGGKYTVSGATMLGRVFGFEKLVGGHFEDIQIPEIEDSWTMSFKQCDNIVIENPQIDNDGVIFQDGIHFLGGSNNQIRGGTIATGDDCISITAENVGENDASDILISGLTLKPKGSSGIKLLTEAASSFTISNVNITNVNIICEGGSRAIEIRNNDSVTKKLFDVKLSDVYIDATNSTDIGILLDDLKDVELHNVTIKAPKAQAMRITAMDGLKVIGGGTSGLQNASTNAITIESGNDLHFTDFTVKDATSHGYNVGTVSQVTGLKIRGGLIKDCTNNGILLTNADGALIEGVTISGCSAPITESGSSNNNLINSNDVRSNTANTITKVGASTKLRGNVGYYTEQSGSTAFSSSASVAVTFTNAMPSGSYAVRLTGTANETFWPTSRTTTGFTINSSNGTSTATAFWEVEL